MTSPVRDRLFSIVRDDRYKRSEYAALGIPEYWIVDPLKRLVTVLFLESGLYEKTEFAGDRAILSRTFPELLLTSISSPPTEF